MKRFPVAGTGHSPGAAIHVLDDNLGQITINMGGGKGPTAKQGPVQVLSTSQEDSPAFFEGPGR